jgi:hypothetical protein
MMGELLSELLERDLAIIPDSAAKSLELGKIAPIPIGRLVVLISFYRKSSDRHRLANYLHLNHFVGMRVLRAQQQKSEDREDELR